MRFLLIWILLSFIAALIARAKGQSGFKYFLLSSCCTPVVGLWAALKVPVRMSRLTKNCMRCSVPSPAAATTCRSCGASFPEIIDVEQSAD